MIRTRRGIAAGSLGAIVFALAPTLMAPGWAAFSWPIGALVLAFEIQAWISLPGTWARTAERRAAEPPATSPEAAAYLDRVDSALGLPPEVRAEIRAELSDHLDDSIEALEGEGLDRARATREALARLGRAEELARQLRAAHQSTRRLLAGAAGGVWSAGVGMVQGYLVVLGLFAICFDLGIVLFQKPIEQAGSAWLGIHLGPSDLEATTALLCGMAWVPAFIAGRRCVRASARLSRRKAMQLRGFWVSAGVAVLGWLVMFHLRIQQSWLVVPVELAVPLAFAAGALVKPDANVHLPRSRSKLALLPAAMLVGGLLMGAAMPDYGLKDVPDGPGEGTLGYDRVAPEVWIPCGPVLPPVGTDGRCPFPLGGGSQVIGDFSGPWAGQWLVDGLKGAPLTAIRIELWRARASNSLWFSSDGNPFTLDATVSAAELVEPATLDGFLRIPADLGTHRQRRWLMFVTGVAADGNRYRLGDATSFSTPFTGTVWDWLTAPG
jgi:hypothetical protein